MASIIIASKDKKKRQAYCKDFCQKHNINTFDITLIEKDTTVKTQSIGIDDVKNMQKKIFLKPLKSKMKAIILEDAHLLTTEAQNALLKVLEEPPEHTIIILGTDSKEVLLPTIISRCQIIELAQEQKDLTDEEIQEYKTLLEGLHNMTIGDRLKKAEIYAKDKEKAITWIENMIIIARMKMLEETGKTDATVNTTLQNIKSFQQLHILLKTTNVNTRFAIENTLLQIRNF